MIRVEGLPYLAGRIRLGGRVLAGALRFRMPVLGENENALHVCG